MICTNSPASFSRARVNQFAAGLFVGCAVFAAAPAGAVQPPVKNTYVTLSLPGVVGDFSTVPNAPTNSIEVLSMSLGASCQHSGTSFRCNVQDLNIIKLADAASPPLFLALVGNTQYATATFYFWEKPTPPATTYTRTYTVYLTQVLLTSFSNGASEGNNSPSESLSMAYNTIAFQDNVSGTASCYNVTTQAGSNSITC